MTAALALNYLISAYARGWETNVTNMQPIPRMPAMAPLVCQVI